MLKQVDDAAKQIKSKLTDETKIKKRTDKLKALIDKKRFEVARERMHPEITIENISNFEDLVQNHIKHGDVKEHYDSINESTQAALDG